MDRLALAAETATEAAIEAEAEEGAGAKALDNLNSIQKAQQRVRSGADGGKRIIDVIKKSEDALKNMLKKATGGGYDEKDWE